jgi:hypothetical protein
MHRDEVVYVKDHYRGICITIKFNDKKIKLILIKYLILFHMNIIHPYSSIENCTLGWMKNNTIGVHFGTIFNINNAFTMNMFNKNFKN